MSKIYFDSVGVIADFYGWVREVTGAEDIKEGSIIDDAMFDNYKSCFLDCKIIKGRETLLDQVIYNDDCYVLTSVPSFTRWKNTFGDKYSDEEIKHRLNTLRDNKIKWYEIFGVPEDKVIICDGTSAKMGWCNPGDVLYDDFQSSVDKWNKMGGIGIWVESK